MTNRITKGLLAIVVMALIMAVVDLPANLRAKLPNDPVSTWIKSQKTILGLDLQGGTQLDYRIDLRNAEAKNSDNDSKNDVRISDIVEGVRNTIERRVNGLGVSEPQIFTSTVAGEQHIIVELAGIKNVEEAKAVVGKTIQLEFKEPKVGAEPGELEAIKKEADDTLAKAMAANANFEVVGENAKTADGKIQFRKGQKQFASELSAQYKNVLPSLAPGSVGKTVIEGSEITLENSQIANRNKLFVVQLASKELADHTTTKYDDFTALAKKMSENSIIQLNGRKKEDFEPLEWSALATTGQGQTTNVLEIGDQLRVYKLDKKTGTGDSAALDVERLAVKKSKRETLDAALKPVKTGTKVTEKEMQFIYNEIAFDYSPDPWKSTGLDGSHFKSASVSYGQLGDPQVSIQFDTDGAKMFEDLTGRLSGQQLAIFVGGDLISSPRVNEKIAGGSAVITGRFNVKEALKLATDLNTGAIDAPIILSGQYTISATLGESALRVSLYGGLVGIIALTIFMLLYYRLLGFFAVLALGIYSIIILFLLKTLTLVMTLAGIAGVILSIGMAVDANILIFERTKEELNQGKNFVAAVGAGFDRAWSSIRDSNVSSLITCAILWFFGNSIIRGFSLMLAIGILTSMFTAITVTRAFLYTIIGTRLARSRFLIGAKKMELPQV